MRFFFSKPLWNFSCVLIVFIFKWIVIRKKKKEYFAIIIKFNAKETNGERLLNLYKTVRYFLEITDVCLIEYNNMCTFKSKIYIKVIIRFKIFKNRKNYAWISISYELFSLMTDIFLYWNFLSFDFKKSRKCHSCPS